MTTFRLYFSTVAINSTVEDVLDWRAQHRDVPHATAAQRAEPTV